MDKGLVYYTDNSCNDIISNAVLAQLKRLCNGMEVVSVSHKPVDFGKNIVMDLPRSAESIFRQIVTGIENIKADFVFLVEHDVLYHQSHFEFIPKNIRHFYYNQNRWSVQYETGKALYRKSKATSHLSGFREDIESHFSKMLNRIERRGYSAKMGVAPVHPRLNYYSARNYISELPNIDIVHSDNFSPSTELFDIYCPRRSGWIFADEVPYWGKTLGRFDELLQEVTNA